MPSGHVRVTVAFPWLAQGRAVEVPELSHGDLLEAKLQDLVVLRGLNLTDQTPGEERGRILDVADDAMLIDVLYRRLRKADPTLTREAFEAAVLTKEDVLLVHAKLAAADEARRPQRL